MLCRQISDYVDIFLKWLVKFYLNNMANLHPKNSTRCARLYPQNGDRVATIDSVSSIHPMYKASVHISLRPQSVATPRDILFQVGYTPRRQIRAAHR